MDTYIVRIYRRIASGAQEAAGTVEHVESGERAGFSGAAELLDRLLGAAAKREDESITSNTQRNDTQ